MFKKQLLKQLVPRIHLQRNLFQNRHSEIQEITSSRASVHPTIPSQGCLGSVCKDSPESNLSTVAAVHIIQHQIILKFAQNSESLGCSRLLRRLSTHFLLWYIWYFAPSPFFIVIFITTFLPLSSLTRN